LVKLIHALSISGSLLIKASQSNSKNVCFIIL
jgi:hypothetical protein